MIGALLAGAGSSEGRSVGRTPILRVTPHEALFDSSTQVVASGLKPRQQIVVQVQSRDAHGVAWSSSTAYVASRQGVVDVGRSAAQSGSYLGVEPMGPFDALAPVGAERPATAYWWPRSGTRSFRVSVSARGHVLASQDVERSAAVAGETGMPTTLAHEGFFGYFFRPPPNGAKHAAVVIFGGSEGGDSTTLAAALLAAHGFPALALAYFGEPGLPQTLSNIPLEYFTRAIKWVARQPGVNPARIFVSGDHAAARQHSCSRATFPPSSMGLSQTSRATSRTGVSGASRALPGPSTVGRFRTRPFSRACLRRTPRLR